MDLSMFSPAGGGFEASFVPAIRCENDLPRCAHRIGGNEVGVTVTANGGSCNYSYAGGASIKCVNMGGATAGDTCRFAPQGAGW